MTKPKKSRIRMIPPGSSPPFTEGVPRFNIRIMQYDKAVRDYRTQGNGIRFEFDGDMTPELLVKHLTDSILGLD